MHHTIFMKRIPLIALALFLAMMSDVRAEASSRKPNILFIAIDDQNDWIGCMGGHPMVKTPNIDKLAARATLFTNAHTQSPLCNSSRTSLMVGLRPSTTGIHGLAPWFRDVPQWEDLLSLPQLLCEQRISNLQQRKNLSPSSYTTSGYAQSRVSALGGSWRIWNTATS